MEPDFPQRCTAKGQRQQSQVTARKILTKNSDKKKKCSGGEGLSSETGVQSHGGLSILRVKKPDWSDFEIGAALSWRLDQLPLSSLNYLSHQRPKTQRSHCVANQTGGAFSASLGCSGRACLHCLSRQSQLTIAGANAQTQPNGVW